MSRAETMRRVRAQALLVRKLSMQMKEYGVDGVGTLRMDGMPRGQGGLPRGLEIRMEKREAMRRVIERESARLRGYEQEARALMDEMRPELYAFCSLYYLAGMNLEDTAEAIDRCHRQARRYKYEIEHS